MLISKNLNDAINKQIASEFGARMQYLSIAAHFEKEKLQLLAKLFLEQSEEENEHAMKFVKYILDTNGDLNIPQIEAPKPTFKSAEEAVQAALDWEIEVTRQIKNLRSIADKEDDYLAQGFLDWFIEEQREEIMKMEQLLSVVKRAGEKNLLMVEAYLVHINES